MALDDDDKKFIADLIKSNNEELGKQFATPDAVTKMVEQNLAKGLESLDLDGKLAAAFEKHKPADKGDDDKKNGKGKAGDDPEILKMRDELAAIKRQAEEATNARKAAEQKQREQALESKARDALAAAGIPAEQHAKALVWLKSQTTADGKPVLDFGEDGSPAYNAQRNGYVDPLTIADGIKEWAGTDDAKTFIPASGVQGTGDGAGGRGRTPAPSALRRDSNGNIDFSDMSRKLSEGLRNSSIK